MRTRQRIWCAGKYSCQPPSFIFFCMCTHSRLVDDPCSRGLSCPFAQSMARWHARLPCWQDGKLNRIVLLPPPRSDHSAIVHAVWTLFYALFVDNPSTQRSHPGCTKIMDMHVWTWDVTDDERNDVDPVSAKRSAPERSLLPSIVCAKGAVPPTGTTNRNKRVMTCVASVLGRGPSQSQSGLVHNRSKEMCIITKRGPTRRLPNRLASPIP